MKCAYCKQTIPEMRDANEEPKERTYIVEINGVECEIWLHDDCLIKVIGEFFSRPPLVCNVTQDKADELIKKACGDRTWSPHWTADNTVNYPLPDTTRVWCKAKVSEDPHSPWKDRGD